MRCLFSGSEVALEAAACSVGLQLLSMQAGGQRCLRGEAFQQLTSLLFVQIKRRASEALPELLRPVTPITNFEGTRPQDPSGIFGLVSNLEQLDVDDWEF